jgi:hypothetical protein
MSKMNLQTHLNIYEDTNPTNNPTMNNVKWTLSTTGLDVSEPESKSLKLQAGETLNLFSGLVNISDDNTTTYNIALKAGTSNSYKISHNAGAAPIFRAARTTGADATTQITVTKNGPILTFASTGGTALALLLGGVLVGDEVRIGGNFNTSNKGKFKLIARTATSFQVENAAGQAEGPITLGVDFATILEIFSSAGVQVGDKVELEDGFSSVTLGTYEITDVNPNYIIIYNIKSLPEETNINTELKIYNNSKKFLYVETNKKLSMLINGISVGNIEQMNAGTSLKKGIFMKSGSMYQASITNASSEEASVFFVSAE